MQRLLFVCAFNAANIDWEFTYQPPVSSNDCSADNMWVLTFTTQPGTELAAAVAGVTALNGGVSGCDSLRVVVRPLTSAAVLQLDNFQVVRAKCAPNQYRLLSSSDGECRDCEACEAVAPCVCGASSRRCSRTGCFSAMPGTCTRCAAGRYTDDGRICKSCPVEGPVDWLSGACRPQDYKICYICKQGCKEETPLGQVVYAHTWARILTHRDHCAHTRPCPAVPRTPCMLTQYCEGDDNWESCRKGEQALLDCGSEAYFCRGGERTSVRSGYYSACFQGDDASTCAQPNGADCAAAQTKRSAECSCSRGHKCRDGVMQACLSETFQDEAGKSSCKDVEPGFFVANAQGEQVTQGATQQLPCLAGSRCNNGVAELCPIGRFQADTGQSRCQVTDPGYYTDSQGATQQKPCEPGFVCPGGGQLPVKRHCDSQYYCPQRTFQQRLCPQGSWPVDCGCGRVAM